MAKTQIKNYVFKPGVGATDNLYPNAYNLLSSNKEFIQKEAIAWIQDQIDAGTSGFVGYTYNSTKCERDVGFNIDAYLKDLRYGGNENTYKTVQYYWDQDIPQIDGTRTVEVQTYNFIKNLVTQYILLNIEYNSSNTEISQTIDSTNTSENEAITIIGNLIEATADVIETGLSAFPTLIATGVGTIKIQGKYDIADLLLISNVTKNEIIYNFSNPSTGATVSFKTDNISNDENFSNFLQTTDTVTTITLNYNTSTHTSDDELQIFIEKTENGKSIVTTRPYDFGTDAIERMRVAPALSMLDADFEYGLQPTKWAAISTLRGYPSVYEIPGTDTPVLSVITDASEGTDGVGQSLITVTTIGSHGLEPGIPITIKALEDSVVGAARAEGSFVINTVPTPTTFTYYAKSKVGILNGDILSTTYTQLRKAGFYTGASIGKVSINVDNNGSAGTLITELGVLTGETRLPYDGPSPTIGAPLVNNAKLASGTQIASVIDQSSGGGVYVTPVVSENISSGSITASVVSSAGIVPGLAVDRGDGNAIFVTDIVGNQIEFSDPFVANLTGNNVSYTNISGNNDTTLGIDATFDITVSTGTYILDDINQSGSGYQIGDRILITGDKIGGVTPNHDAVVLVETVFSDGAIATATIAGTPFDGTESLTGVSATYDGGQGTGAEFDIAWEDNEYTIVDISSPDDSTNYIVNDIIRIPGNLIDPANGLSPQNDLYVTVTGLGAGGAITSLTFDGTAPDYINTFIAVPYSTSGSGTGAEINVTSDSGSYTVDIILPGQDFLPGDTITVLGSDLGGSTPTNDLTITVDNVGGLGEILTVSTFGFSFNGSTASTIAGENIVGSGATFNVELSAGTYIVTIETPGSQYGVNQQLTITGDQLFGTTPANDLTITVTAVDELSSGVITSINSSGTANTGGGTFIGVSGVPQDNVGVGALFNINKEFTEYSSIILANGGSEYAEGNRIIIPGTSLNGQSPLNDISLRVLSVDSFGTILTFVSDYVEAEYGVNFDLFSTVGLTEPITENIFAGETADFEELATLSIQFTNAHGLVPGSTFIVTVNSDNGANNHSLAAGSFFATEIPSTTQLKYQARAAGTIDTDQNEINSIVYPRPDSFFIHRPFDGGVQLGTGGPQHGAQAIRQSKKYIRYQSGKGIMYTTGALFAPSYDLRSVTAEDVEVGSLITIVTDDNDHGVQEGGIIRLLGIETPGFNSGPETATPPMFDYEVVDVVDERTFKIRSQRRLGSTDAVLGFGAQMSVVRWHGATVRSGIFDDQNGIFWEYDGTQISVVQRTGTRQISGTISMQVDDNQVIGLNTRFRDQLKAGDKIIIKGMTHVVSHVNSQTSMTVTPDWRGVVDIIGAKVNLVVDKKVKQEHFNLDKLDGTGPSGYNIDIAKMQMIGIQYSWYGAGFIDFMLRGADGNFVFAHRMRNSNVNTEAFMRSGNLPVRYEVTNEGPAGKLAAAMDNAQTFIELEDSSFFPDSGYVYIDNEIISFSENNKLTNTLGGCIRSATFTNFQAGASRSYTAGTVTSHSARTGVILISQTITPLISHWGSAFITDGGFDEDRGYIFSYAETGITVTTTKQTAFMIRLAPSVSNALVGDLGERELLNRAQLLLQGIEITSDSENELGDKIQGGIVVEGILNPQNYPLDPGSVGWQELSNQAQGGQPSFAQIASGGAIDWTTSDDVTSSTATAQGDISTTVNLRLNVTDRNYIYVRRDSWDESGASVGDFVTASSGGASFGSGIRINSVFGPYSSGSNAYYFVRLDNNYSGTTSGNVTVQRRTTLSNRNFAYLTTASFNSSGAAIGSSVNNDGTVTFPAGTQISNIQQETFGSTTYYLISFNNSFNGTLTQGSGTIGFEFRQPPFGQPGETVFSFIATPGERSELMLTELKELTNTPLGGRGTYPNGPDVLAINIYKVSGEDTNANLILRWGEAQA